MADNKGIKSIEALPAQVRLEQTTSSSTRSRAWWKFGGKDYSHVSIDDGIESETSSISSGEERVVKRRHSVFQAAEAVELYKPVEGYEGSHRFDPKLVWAADEEKRLVRKVSIADRPSVALNFRTTAYGVYSSTGGLL